MQGNPLYEQFLPIGTYRIQVAGRLKELQVQYARDDSKRLRLHPWVWLSTCDLLERPCMSS